MPHLRQQQFFIKLQSFVPASEVIIVHWAVASVKAYNSLAYTFNTPEATSLLLKF